MESSVKRLRRFVACLALLGSAFAGDLKSSIELLDGYRLTKDFAVDAAANTIEGERGFKIEFEAGPNEGLWADPAKATDYAWYRRLKIRGCTVHMALIKRGLRTVWEPAGAEKELGNVLLVTFSPRPEDQEYTANFSAKIHDEKELADALVMILTFDTKKFGL
jgi:hypothetical protein